MTIWVPKKRKNNIGTIMVLVGSTLNQWNREDGRTKKLVWNLLPENSELFLDFRDSYGHLMVPRPLLGIQALIYEPTLFTSPSLAFAPSLALNPPCLEINVEDGDNLTLCGEKEVSTLNND
ncbi:hypothetical protein HMI55_002174 [Coelomomyces lativittatus]|nr:hypothetical protein HMI56_001995 [Coelomomyces lativittatus]KAJ1504095.1 hypothetical protein HMI55_002174 [Coelomomyces lativittatus]